jgi:hypothetical protein
VPAIFTIVRWIAARFGCWRNALCQQKNFHHCSARERLDDGTARRFNFRVGFTDDLPRDPIDFQPQRSRRVREELLVKIL